MQAMMLFLAIGAPDGDSDARAALALASALPRQAPLPPQAPPVTRHCYCDGPQNCTCGERCDCAACVNTEPVYQWRKSADNPRFLLLRRGGNLVGCYDIENGFYWAWNAARGEYEERFTKPPTDVPPGFIPPRKAAQAPEPLYLQPFVQGPQFFQGGGAYCPPGASS